MNSLAVFAAFALMASITPGPANIAIFAASTHAGMRRALGFISGTLLGFVVVLIGGVLLKLLDGRLPTSVSVALEVIGGAYLLYLAYRNWCDAGADVTSLTVSFRAGALIHPLSSKAWIFVLTAFAIFVPSAAVGNVIGYGVVFFIIALISHLAWMLLGGFANQCMGVTGRRRLNRGAAVVMAVLVLVSIEATL